jgi:arginyl-tRNA synthetase
MLMLDRLPIVLDQAITKRAPNVLCAYVFELAQAYSRFWTAHHILTEPDERRRARWLTMTALTRTALTEALTLLGIEVPERM